MLDNIVILGSLLANSRHAAPVQLAEALSQRHSVLYVEPFCYGEYRQQEDCYKACHTSLRLSAGVKILSPLSHLLSEPTYYRWLMLGMVERINATRITEEVEWALRTLGIEEYTLLIDTPSLRNSIVTELLAPNALYILRWQEWQTQTEQQEAERGLLTRCDAVLATSESLAELPRRYNQHTFNISGGIGDLAAKKSDEVWRAAARRVDAVAEMLGQREGATNRSRARKREVIS